MLVKGAIDVNEDPVKKKQDVYSGPLNMQNVRGCFQLWYVAQFSLCG